ncbi:MAG: hypothetical protein IJH78_01585 [Clostridia bacterium]|nr:hypothetical protein [Clostridia bacterium]
MATEMQARRVYEEFKTWLNSKNFRYDPHDNDLVISMTVRGEDLPQPTLIRVMADRDVVQILSPIPGNIPENKRMDAAVAVAVANYGLINGSFDLDMNDGEIRYRVCQSFKESQVNQEMVGYLLNVVFFTTDKYNDAFFMLGKGMMSLEDFIKKEQSN